MALPEAFRTRGTVSIKGHITELIHESTGNSVGSSLFRQTSVDILSVFFGSLEGKSFLMELFSPGEFAVSDSGIDFLSEAFEGQPTFIVSWCLCNGAILSYF